MDVSGDALGGAGVRAGKLREAGGEGVIPDSIDDHP